jgi:hypothetical protein
MEFPEADEYVFVNPDLGATDRLVERQTSDTWTEIAFMKPRPMYATSFADITRAKPVYEAVGSTPRLIPQKNRRRKIYFMTEGLQKGESGSNSTEAEAVGKQTPKRFKKHNPRKTYTDIKINNRRKCHSNRHH